MKTIFTTFVSINYLLLIYLSDFFVKNNALVVMSNLSKYLEFIIDFHNKVNVLINNMV